MKQTFPIKHYPFAVFFVNKIIKKIKTLEPYREDLISAAVLGLLEAEEKFDPNKGTKFLTFAVYHIKNRVYTEITNIQGQGFKKTQPTTIEEIKVHKALKKNSEATYKEVEKETKIKEKRVKQILEDKKNVISLEEPIGENLKLKDTIGEDPTTRMEKEIDTEKVQKLLKKAISILDEREKMIIRERYLEEEKKALESIGKKLGISRERARQIEQRALKKMRVYMLKKNIKLDDFMYL